MKKIVVAMSGGLDSSVAAALLKEAGFDAIGVFMKFWSPKKGTGRENRCCSTEAENRARKVAKILKIPFYVFNFEKEFKKEIVDYFLSEYKKGVTPNPCVKCNKEIKFGLLLEKALELGADYIATGHYARLRRVGYNLKLLKGRDKNKDQSYFLWRLNQKQLRRVLFPIGDYIREEVLSLAGNFKLSFFTRVRKSQEVCFIQDAINDFLKKYLKTKPGEIIDNKRDIIGKHPGLWFYTIGQRKGIGRPDGPAFSGAAAGKPYYVLDKDVKNNILIVTNREKDLYASELNVKNVNWVSGKEPKLPLKVKVKIRYRHQSDQAILTKNPQSKIYNLKFKKPQRAITPGQSAVFYKGEEVLGGGIVY